MNSTDFTSNPCPAGYYCPNGTQFDSQYPCPIGYYNPVTGKTSIDDCLPCPSGEYCASSGLSSTSGLCDAGFYCVLAAWLSQPTEIGNYSAPDCFCPNNQTGGQCIAGTYCPVGSGSPTPCTGGNLIREIFKHLPFTLVCSNVYLKKYFFTVFQLLVCQFWKTADKINAFLFLCM